MVSDARLIVISGCSGGGKSTLIDELARRGHATVDEVGRRLLRADLAAGGTTLWSDPDAFLRRMVAASLADRDAATQRGGTVFFDRSLVDALSGLRHRTGGTWLAPLGAAHRYHARVFLAPPWPDIYVQDDERRHDFASAEAEYRRLAHDYPALGYAVVDLPRLPVAERADRLLAALEN